MPVIDIKDFIGEFPQVATKNLPDNAASRAVNCDLKRGKIEAVSEIVSIGEFEKPGEINSMHLFDRNLDNPDSGFIWHWEQQGVSAVRGAIPGDTSERTYFAADGSPRVAYKPEVGSGFPGPNRRLGVTRPDASLTTITGQIPLARRYTSSALDEDGYFRFDAFNTAFAPPLKAGDIIWFENASKITGVDVDSGNGKVVKYFTIGEERADLNGQSFNLLDDAGEVPIPTWQNDTDPSTVYQRLFLEPHPIVGLLESGEIKKELKSRRTYVVTYVTDLGEESAPSDPIGPLYHINTNEVFIAGLPVSADQNVARKRIYREDAGAYLFVAEFSNNVTSYIDMIRDIDLAEPLETHLYDPPPDGLKNLMKLPDGGMAGFMRNQLLLATPYQPHAWPILWRKTMNYPIVGIASIDNIIVILTEVDIYLANYYEPSALQIEETASSKGCVSAPSIVSTELGVFFASSDGLELVAPGGIKRITDGMLTEHQWQALDPKNIQSSTYHDGMLWVSFQSETLLFDFTKGKRGLVRRSEAFNAMLSDPMHNRMYISTGRNKGYYSLANAKMTYSWESKTWDLGKPANMTCLKVIADDYSYLYVSIYADNQLVGDYLITSDKAIKIDKSARADHWRLVVTGQSSVSRITLSSSMRSLR